MWVATVDGNFVNLNASAHVQIADQGDGTFALYAGGFRLLTTEQLLTQEAAQAVMTTLLGSALVTI